MKLSIQENKITEETLSMCVRGGGLGLSAWVAKISGEDEKFGFKREFCKKNKNLSNSEKSGIIEFELSGAGLYEFRNVCYNSSRTFSGFFLISEDEIKEVSRNESISYLQE